MLEAARERGTDRLDRRAKASKEISEV